MSVSPDTRNRIFKIAEELNYVKHTQNKKQIKDRPLEKRLAIIQWYTEQEEVHDLLLLRDPFRDRKTSA